MQFSMTEADYTRWINSGNYLSGPLVMRSAAGWYVGELCLDDDLPNFPQPYDRYTGYFATEAEAERALIAFLDFDEEV
jgi:hypothetical protein